MTTTATKIKHDPAKRKREALNNNFEKLDLAGKFQMIKRQKDPAISFRLFNRLTTEDQVAFVRSEYRGLKVTWRWMERHGLQFSPRVKIVPLGYSLEVWPKIGNVKYNITLIRQPNKFNDERTLETLQRYLPTVKVL